MRTPHLTICLKERGHSKRMGLVDWLRVFGRSDRGEERAPISDPLLHSVVGARASFFVHSCASVFR